MPENPPPRRTHGPFSRVADWLDSWAPVKLLRVVEVIAILAALVGFSLELQQRSVDRAVRVATLFAQIAQVHALPEGAGLKALTPSVVALASENVPMVGINLSGADLSGADLGGAILFGADLSVTDLTDVNLSGANLIAADLRRANLDGANLSGADLSSANLRSRDLSLEELRILDVPAKPRVFFQGPTQDQLNTACGDEYTQTDSGLSHQACKRNPADD